MTTPVTSVSASPPMDGSGVRPPAVPASQDGQSEGTPPQEVPPLDRSSEKETPEPASPGTRPAEGRPLLPRSLVMLLGAGSAVLVLAAIRSVAWLVGPVFLALMIVIAIAPVQSALLRRGWPAWLGTLLLVLLVT